MVSFTPSQFHYIKLRDYGDRDERKLPLEQWGGYDTDFEENDKIYSYEETHEEDHPNWGIVGIRHDRELVIVDIDAHKVDDFVPADLKRPHEEVTIVKSNHPDRDTPGFHFYLLLEADETDVSSTKEWIDIKANSKGHVVSPFHNEQYEHVHGKELIEFPNVTEINRHLEYQGELLLTSEDEYTTEFSGGSFEPLEEPPEDIPYCLRKCLVAREAIPRDGSHFNPWKVDSATGRRLVALGYSKREAMTLLEQYGPKDGWDAKETSYQLDMLYQKQLNPESPKTLVELDIFDEDDYCGCEVCASYETDDASDAVLPDEIYTDLRDAGLDADTHATVQGTARSGKTHGITQRACEAWDGEKIVCLSPTHEEAKAWIDKWKQHNVTPAYLVGEEHAREQYDLDTSGPVDMSKEAITPTDAQDYEGCNAYQSYVMNAVEADVIVTVPELINRIDDYDWIIATEEAAIKRLTASPMPVMCVQRYENPYLDMTDRNINEALRGGNTCLDIIDDIEALDQTDDVHDAIYEAAKCIVDMSEMVSDWVPRGWEGVQDDWMNLVTDIERRLEQMKDVQKPAFHKVYQRLQNYNRVDTEILNTLYYDGILQYGNSDDNRKQLFYVGDTERSYVPIEDDVTVWLGGNSIPMMTKFHEIVHGDPPEPIGYKNDYAPLRKALDDNIVIKYTGRENQNQQSRDVQKTIEQIQQLSPESPSSLLISGSSEYTAEHAERIKQCTRPTGNDDLDTIRDTYLSKANMCVVFPENSQWSEGVDIPEAQMGAIYNGHFAAPFEEYIKEKTGDPTLLRAERVRAAQNATLRPSNIPSRTEGVIGTGKTPLLVPSYHVPDEIFDLFEEYDLNVYQADDIAEIRRLLITVLDLEAEEYDGKIMAEEDLPPKIKKFRELKIGDGEDAG